MTKPQRVALTVYCLLLAYCSIWIPWCIPDHDLATCVRIGYGMVWAGPKLGGVFDSPASLQARPDVELIVIRLVALSAAFGAVFVFTGLWQKSNR